MACCVITPAELMCTVGCHGCLVQRQHLVGAQYVTVSSGSVSVLLLDSSNGGMKHPRDSEQMECSTEPRGVPLRLSLDF